MILLLGGTSDSLAICDYFNKYHKEYIVSVTTEYGKELCKPYTSNIALGKLDLEAMKRLIRKENITKIIDATHPYAALVSKTAMEAAKELTISYKRYERESLLEEVNYNKLYITDTLEEAIGLAKKLGTRIFLGTGSNQLKVFWEALREHTLIARVLPTSEVIIACEEIGFKADQIVAMKGPFSKEMNISTLNHYAIDLMITKESGKEGGFLEKIEAAKALDIPVIVIKRQHIDYRNVTHRIEELM